MEIARVTKKIIKKIIIFYKKINFFNKNKSVRIASYVRKPVKTMEIRKTRVKNVQIDASVILQQQCYLRMLYAIYGLIK